MCRFVCLSVRVCQHTPPGCSGRGGQAQLQAVAQLAGVLHQQTQEAQGRHDDHVIIALLARVVGQQKLGVFFVHWDLIKKKGRVLDTLYISRQMCSREASF